MKKVLVIAYYWPPSGGGGVQRWLKFAKYLPELGWEPIVYVPENADYPIIDESLVDEVPPSLQIIRRPIVEPRRLYRFAAGRKDRQSQEADEIFHRNAAERSWKQQAAVWMRGNLLIPDARVLWVRPSVRFLTNRLKNDPVDAIVTTGPPHSMHLIGRQLKRRIGIPWIADFRDPWTEIEFFGDMQLTRRAEAKHRRLEEAVLREADGVTTVSPTWAKGFQSKARQVSVITNGFDEDDFSTPVAPDTGRFRITHVGSLSMDRNPEVLWKALAALCAGSPEFQQMLEIELVGRVDPGIVESVKEYGLTHHLNLRGYVSHRESIGAMRRSAVQLLLINRDAANAPGRIPGKLFEYIAACRPVLLLSPVTGDAARIVSEAGVGASFSYDDVDGVQTRLKAWFDLYGLGKLNTSPQNSDAFSRRRLTASLADILTSVVGSAPTTGE